MRRGFATAATAFAILVAGLALIFLLRRPTPEGLAQPSYAPPPRTVVTRLSGSGATATLTIEAATDVSVMRPLLRAFQRRNPGVAIAYVDMLSTDLFRRAQRRCDEGGAVPDVYVTISTDHLVRLANDGCAEPLSAKALLPVPVWAQWRGEVVAFSLEPAVIVYDRRALPPKSVPDSHAALIELLRRGGETWRGRIGTYDIERSGSGYIYAELDSRQSPLYGRLIESLGRARTRLYCCSNTMVDAVARGEVRIAYNVQLSYALAARRAGLPIGIVLPADYQAILSRSAMIPKGAAGADLARRFVTFLSSPEGQAIVAGSIAAPAAVGRFGGQPVDRVVAQASVTPLLLRLQDQARRRRLIREWRQALLAVPPR